MAEKRHMQCAYCGGLVRETEGGIDEERGLVLCGPCFLEQESCGCSDEEGGLDVPGADAPGAHAPTKNGDS